MHILREVAAGLLKMFVGDVWLTVGVLLVIAVTALLTSVATVAPLLAGAVLFVGCVGVLLSSVMLAGRKHRDR
jgi:hypothetical protein